VRQGSGCVNPGCAALTRATQSDTTRQSFSLALQPPNLVHQCFCLALQFPILAHESFRLALQ